MEIVEKAKPGVLLVGHGTREPAGVRQFLETASLVADALPQFTCQSCFLEIAEPDIFQGVGRLLAAGVERIVVMPLLLFSAGHAKQDVPQSVQAALAQHAAASVRWVQAAHLGVHDALLQQSAARIEQAIADTSVADADICLVVVGRGSLDGGAIAEMHRYANVLAQRLNNQNYRVAFYAMAHPKLRDVLDQVAAELPPRVMVLPHLLFDGLIMQAIGELVDQYRSGFPRIAWHVAQPLGPTPPVIAAICERILAAAQTWQKPDETSILQGTALDRQL